MGSCPGCSGSIEVIAQAGVEFGYCSRCRRIWCDGDALERLLQLADPPVPFFQPGQSPANAEWDPPPAFCPHCSAALKLGRVEGAIPVMTQVCPESHGLWIGRSEWQRIKRSWDERIRIPFEDDVQPEKIEVGSQLSRPFFKTNWISGKIKFVQKSRLILAATLILALAATGLFLSWTPGTPGIKAVSRMTPESNVISKEFATPVRESKASRTNTDYERLARETPPQNVPAVQQTQANPTQTTTTSTTGQQSQPSQKELQDKALAAKIDAYLGKRKSPMSGTGATFVAAGNSTGVDPVLSVAIAGKESSFGLFCFCPHNAWGMKAPQYTKGFATWEEGIWANSRYLLSHFGKVSSPYQCAGYCVPDHPWMEDVASIMAAIQSGS